MIFTGTKGGRDVMMLPFLQPFRVVVAGALRKSTRLLTSSDTREAQIISIADRYDDAYRQKALNLDRAVSIAEEEARITGREVFKGGIGLPAAMYRVFDPPSKVDILCVVGRDKSSLELAAEAQRDYSGGDCFLDSSGSVPGEVIVDAPPASALWRQLGTKVPISVFMTGGFGGAGAFHCVYNYQRPDPELVDKLRQMMGSGTLVCFQPESFTTDPISRDPKPGLEELPNIADILVADIREAEAFTCQIDAVETLRSLARSRLRGVAIVSGYSVAGFYNNMTGADINIRLLPSPSFVPAQAHDYYSKIGVVDAVSAVMTSCLARGVDFYTALVLANCAASIEAVRLARLSGAVGSSVPAGPLTGGVMSLAHIIEAYNAYIDSPEMDDIAVDLPYLQIPPPHLMDPKGTRPLAN